jgi:hypothetical protein
MKNIKEGKIIIPSGVYPEKHELITVDYFLKQGKDVHFLKPSRTKGTKTPDVEINHQLWEIKALTGKSKRSIGDHLYRASRQSPNIILDARQYKQPKPYIIKEVTKQYNIRVLPQDLSNINLPQKRQAS